MTLIGQDQSKELDEATALKIAEVMVAVMRGNVESTRYGRFILNFFALSGERYRRRSTTWLRTDAEISDDMVGAYRLLCSATGQDDTYWLIIVVPRCNP